MASSSFEHRAEISKWLPKLSISFQAKRLVQSPKKPTSPLGVDTIFASDLERQEVLDQVQSVNINKNHWSIMLKLTWQLGKIEPIISRVTPVRAKKKPRPRKMSDALTQKLNMMRDVLVMKYL